MSNAFMVVFLVVVVAIGAGVFYTEYIHEVAQNAQVEATAESNMQEIEEANSKNAEMQKTITALQTENADLKEQGSIQTASQQACEQDRANLTHDLQVARDGQVQAEATAISLMQCQSTILSRQNQEGQHPFTQATPTPIVKAQEPSQVKAALFPVDLENALLPTLGIGLFGAVVYASYRMLKIEEHPQRPARRYSSDVDTVFVKMTRQEAARYAHRYARDRSKGG